MNEPVVLFDGECNLCHRSVRFILRHEQAPTLKFASLQSDPGKKLRQHHQLPDSIGAMVLTQGDRVWTGSDAALEISRYLKAPARWLRAGRILPPPFRRLLYRFIAKHRFRWFGHADQCALPSENTDPSRFLS